MIRAEFIYRNNAPLSFKVSGHADYQVNGDDIVCAAVTSAVRLTEIMIDDVICAGADVAVDEKNAGVSLRLKSGRDNSEAEKAISALRLYLEALSEEYPENIRIKIQQM